MKANRVIDRQRLSVVLRDLYVIERDLATDPETREAWSHVSGAIQRVAEARRALEGRLV